MRVVFKLHISIVAGWRHCNTTGCLDKRSEMFTSPLIASCILTSPLISLQRFHWKTDPLWFVFGLRLRWRAVEERGGAVQRCQGYIWFCWKYTPDNVVLFLISIFRGFYTNRIQWRDVMSMEWWTMVLVVFKWVFCNSPAATSRHHSHRGRESLFMGYNETRDVGTLTINFISDCDNDVTLLYLPTATGRSSTSTPLIKPPPLRWMHKFSQPPQVRSACKEARY